MGDMTRKSWRTDIWNADSFLENYPRLCTQIDALDAVWNLAIRIFQQCTYGGYSLTGQEECALQDCSKARVKGLAWLGFCSYFLCEVER